MLDRQAHDDATPDGELIAAAAVGDRSAFERLVMRHAAAVLRLATIVTGDPVSAEDAAQQAFLSAFRDAKSFRAEASFRAWLLTITRHAAYRVSKKQSREEPMGDEPLMPLGLEAGWGSDDPEALAIAAERRDLLQRALESLSAADQEVLALRDIEGLHGAEAAEVLGIGERALKSRLHRARLRLAVALRATALEDSDKPEGGER